ncbi:hypothetical protein H257_16948 [Aphanomyces astaci]|uniref:Leucine-rich repeat-containing protein 72 n=1 Tax=Aphanomyces astaci TaxID=112090 RepID=W4FIU4_APHAT|nr:hypothetical protein H257_16948 [Aphanomyces astaci]ETV66643.1 hypothetical protein H257_16948 [Aphanomyces astaci]|eukprot:XP_009843872.1 hypothetical protein H257_16948 [Aphanomyces astaci]
MRVSNPHGELAVCNEKYVKECTELVMSHRGIDVIGNFDAFVSVEVLWLNHNNIEKITGLDNCFRIKYLYLQHNHIRSLEGSLRHFTFLRELRLYHNNLHDLHSALKLLEKLVHLEDLDLFGNPLAEEDKYRLHVIASIPSLQVFDRHVVTPEEQLSAKKLSIKRSGGSSAHEHRQGPRLQASTMQRYAPLSGTVKMLLKEVATIERNQKLADELERAKCFELVSPASQAAGPSSPQANDTTTSLARNCGMDDWVMCHLRKVFKSLDTKKLGGVLNTQFATVVSEMLDQGYQLIWADQPLTEESNLSALWPLMGKAIGPDPDDDDERPRHVISWAAFSQAFTQRHVGGNQEPFYWVPLGIRAIEERAQEYFDKAALLQKKLSLLTSPNNQLTQQVHVYSQRGYHLTSLKDQLTRTSHHEIVRTQHQTPPSVLRDSVTLFSYKTKGAKKLMSQPDEDEKKEGTALTKKYNVKSKDFQAYLEAKEARKPVRVTKQSLAI